MDTDERTRTRLARLEQAYAASPARYRLRLLLWAGLGHALLLGLLLGCAGILVAMAWRLSTTGFQIEAVLPAFLVGAVTVAMLRALWFRLLPPEGHRLAADEAPALQAEIERVRQAVGAQPLDGVFITAELNAAAVYEPRFAGLAGGRHYLVLGLPLMHLLDRDELAAVIAHEFGHFHGGDGRFSAWIYRVRVGWWRVAQDLSTHGFALQVPLLLFLRWYLPRLEEASLVVSRQQELAADAVAARVSGAQAAGASLVRLGIASDWMERCFWPEVERTAQTQPYPPVRIHERLAGQLEAGRGRPRCLPGRLLRQPPDPRDTHPPLAQRLEALEVPADLTPSGAATSAADALLDPALRDGLHGRFGREWQEAARHDWGERHRELLSERGRLDALADAPSRSAEQTFDYAGLLERHRPDMPVAALYAEVLQAMPAHPRATGRLALALMREGRHQDGEAALRRALDMDASIGDELLSALHDLQAARPDDTALQALADAMQARHRVVAGEQEQVAAHTLDPHELAALATVLSAETRVASAWLVRRGPADPLAPPHHLLLVHWKGSVASEATALPRLAARLRGPGTYAVLGSDADRALVRRIRATAGAPFHRRP